MLIRWATADERAARGRDDTLCGEYEMLVAVERMTNRILATLTFSRSTRRIGAVRVVRDQDRTSLAAENLLRVAMLQVEGRGGSFHHNYPRYARWALPETCPVCNNEQAAADQTTIAELEWAWVDCSPMAQGRLFGKCTVLSKVHSEHFHDLPAIAVAGFMANVQQVARALHEITGAVKINYEMHGNSAPHLHMHLFPRYLDDDFPAAPIDYRVSEPSPYESQEEYLWFVDRMRQALSLPNV